VVIEGSVRARLAAILLALAGLAPVAVGQSPADALFRTGLSNLQAQRFEQAEAAFRQLSDAEPGTLRGLLGVAQVYMAQHKEDDALRVLEEESAKPPVRPGLLVAIGDTAMRARRFDEAIAEFQQALEGIGFKSETTFYVHRGAIGGNPVVDSVNALVGPDATPKGAASVYLRLSEAWHQKGDDKTALATLGNARELLPRDPVILGNLAMLLEAAGQKRDALDAYRGVLEASPNNALALNNAAFLMAETGGDLYQALRYARRAQLLEPKLQQISDTIGWVTLKLGWTDDAVGTFVQLVRSQPANITYRAHLAAALDKMAFRSPAVDELKAALRKEPSPDNEQTIKTLLNRLATK
jgi:tetratricopeptide (TPR) repeat protein